MMHPDAVKKMLEAAFPQSQIEVRDMTGTGDHFDIQIASALFGQKSLIQQHQMVYQALGSEMDRGIHAVQIKTRSL